jgi:formate dehydrogenase maturation protein FdhE
MALREPALPETRARRCPACASERVTPVSHVTAFSGVIKVEHRCEACTTAFLVVRVAIA